MFIRIFALFGLAFALSGTQCRAQEPSPCTEGELNCFTFSSANRSFTYQFGIDGQLTVQFDVVRHNFDLRAGLHTPKPTDSRITCEGPCPTTIKLAPSAFPNGTICVSYGTSTPGQCDQYDFSGFSAFSSCPHGVPCRNIDYTGLIGVYLSYVYTGPVRTPAFGHAPGDITTFIKNVLLSYSSYPPCPGETQCDNGDPGMGTKVPGLSSFVALDEPLEEDDCFKWVSPTKDGQIFTAGEEIEVKFRLSDGCAGKPIRDKDARLSLSRVDNGNLVFVPLSKDEGGKQFQFDQEEGVNEREVDTEGLKPGIYIITVFSDEFSPQDRTVVIK